MKKVLSIALALLLVIGLVSFAKPASADAEEITLWTYPIGNWGNEETVTATTRSTPPSPPKPPPISSWKDPSVLSPTGAPTATW